MADSCGARHADVARPAAISAEEGSREIVVLPIADEFPDDLETTALGEAPPGDEDLETRVLAELAADAETTDLLIEVAASNGVTT